MVMQIVNGTPLPDPVIATFRYDHSDAEWQQCDALVGTLGARMLAWDEILSCGKSVSGSTLVDFTFPVQPVRATRNLQFMFSSRVVLGASKHPGFWGAVIVDANTPTIVNGKISQPLGVVLPPGATPSAAAIGDGPLGVSQEARDALVSWVKGASCVVLTYKDRQPDDTDIKSLAAIGWRWLSWDEVRGKCNEEIAEEYPGAALVSPTYRFVFLHAIGPTHNGVPLLPHNVRRFVPINKPLGDEKVQHTGPKNREETEHEQNIRAQMRFFFGFDREKVKK